MTKEEFSQAILECFSEVYGKKYIGSLFITKKPNGAIDVAIGYNHAETPQHLMAELNEEDYIKWFKKELWRLRLDQRAYGHVSRVSTIPPMWCPHKQQIYEQRRIN